MELKEIHGEVKSVRTEAWLGGSPVIFVNNASDDAIRAAGMETGEPAVADISSSTLPAGIAEISIDHTAKTAAVAASMASDGSRKIDPAAFDLRLD